jgi:hypothetical protein
MGEVRDMTRRLLKSYSESETLARREKYKVQWRITGKLQEAMGRGVYNENHLGVVAVLELLMMGYDVEYVEINITYSMRKGVTLFFKASVRDSRSGRVIDFSQLLPPL